MRAFAAASLAACVWATGSQSARVSRGAVLSALSSPPPSAAADPAFECAWRALAFEYAQQLQPFRPAQAFADIHDGLQLQTLCNATFVAPAAAAQVAAPRAPAAATTFYIDYAAGDDGAAGSLAAPFKTLAHGVAAGRAAPQPVALVLRGGVHRLAATVTLGAADAGLAISAYAGETPVLTSGLPLVTRWQQVAAPAPAPAARAAAGTSTSRAPLANCTWTVFTAEDAMYDDYPSPTVADIGPAASPAACEAACVALAAQGKCFSWTWYDPKGNFGPPWSGHCFARSDATWAPTAQHDTFAGYCVAPPVPPNVWVADLAAGGTPVPAALTDGDAAVPTLLFSPDGGASPQRAIRARWPNANPELDLFPKGWASGGARHEPLCNASDSNVTDVPLPLNYGPGMFADYQFGEGGPCNRFGAGEWLPEYGPTTISYWCAPGGRTAGCSYFVRSPLGFTLAPAELPRGATYDTAALVRGGATVHYWRNGHWFSMATRVAAAAVNASDKALALSWTYGAFQGAEGDSTGEDWFIEHVREELDAPKEFFLDAATQKLYFFHNASAGTPPPAGWTFEVPALAVLINISGTVAAPAVGISISGLTFTGAAATILSDHGSPSGGDWGLSRLGAVLISGAEQVTLANNLFTRLDGNAVFLSGYTRNVTVDRNEFVWLGESAVASWGMTAGVDATAGTQPWFTRVTDNICHEIGHTEKQVSCYFAATSHAATVSGNIMYNMPRAAVNFNDDMAGGSKLLRNLVWNTCRESQDHGKIKSHTPLLCPPFPSSDHASPIHPLTSPPQAPSTRGAACRTSSPGPTARRMA